ncbi:hypothetical protein FBZ87_1152 [Nitrospirillum amazonense]|uniref:Uncharacterized protein n=1 Tax=Nitrospirillum amazonense TaxID=28077 RepID=A0A560J503_9PROT|nr:hypothetical protein FBZ87_1152 [Nitrospirillum amazonense]
MGEGVIAILEFGLFVFLATAGISVVVSLVAHVYSMVLEHTADVSGLRQRLARYARIASGLSDRVEARKSTAAGAATVLFSTQRQEAQLKKKVRELEASPHRFVRILGHELLPNRPFEFLVMNSSVSHQVKRGERHAFFDSSWARPVPVHVWATNMEEARAEFERAFPRTLGFKITHAQSLPTDVALTDPATMALEAAP